MTKKKLAAAAAGVLLAVCSVVYLAFPGLLLEAAIGWERRAAGLAKKSVAVDGGTIAYLEGGPATAPVLLLVHGFAADKDNWTRFARNLTPHYRVIAPDLPGFGESTRDPQQRYDVLSQVQRLHAFAGALGLGRVHVAGNSMGGQIAAVYAAEYPDGVESLAMLAPGGLRSPRRSEMSTLLLKGQHPLLVQSREDFDRLMRFVFVEVPAAPGVIFDYLAARAVESRPFNEKVWQDLMNPPRPLERDLNRIRTRTLVIWGDTDRVLDVSGVEMLDLLLPEPPATVIMKSCGHAPMIERPAEAAGHYQRFLEGPRTSL